MQKSVTLLLGLSLSGCASVGPFSGTGLTGLSGTSPSAPASGSQSHIARAPQKSTADGAANQPLAPLSALSSGVMSPQADASGQKDPVINPIPAPAAVVAIAKPPPQESARPFSFFSRSGDELIFSTPRHENLIDRIKAGFDLPELPTPLVQTHEEWIVRNPEYLKRVFERGGKYLHHIVEELEARKLPTELALLPIVESAFNPKALSSAKAAGLWQFIPSTGRIYDLKQDWWLDQRRDVIESTRAALDYLQKLYEIQDNDWFLALASYNWGEGSVKRARKRNESQGKPTDYLNLKMPRETRNYVPKLIALRNVLADPQRFGIEVPFIENKPYFVVIDKEQSIDLKLAARFADMTVAEFTELNPSHHRPVISASRHNRIVLPADRAARFNDQLQAYQQSGQPLVSWKPYTLRPGETLSVLAQRSGVPTRDLILANSLRQNANPLPGTVLLAPIAAQVDEAHIENTLARFRGTKVVEHERVPPLIHKVRKNETLASIARKHGTTQDRLRSMNNLQGEVKVGMRLVVRQSFNRTVMTDERGVKQVVKGPQKSTDVRPKAVATAEATKPVATTPKVASAGTAGSSKPPGSVVAKAATPAKTAQAPTKAANPQAPEPKTVASAASSSKVKPQ